MSLGSRVKGRSEANRSLKPKQVTWGSAPPFGKLVVALALNGAAGPLLAILALIFQSVAILQALVLDCVLDNAAR